MAGPNAGEPLSPGSTVVPHAEPVDGGTGPVGVVLSHGFTGSPHSMRPWAAHLLQHGFRVIAPRLPGHGTTWQDMNRTGWQDWYATIERAYLRLAAECEVVFAGGQSMGGALVLRLAAEHPSLAGVAVVNPSLRGDNPGLFALPVLRKLTASLPSFGRDINKPDSSEGAYDRLPLHALASLRQLWRSAPAFLPRITQPLLVFRSPQDHVVGPASTRLLRSRVGSREIEEHVLPNSYHVGTLDYDAPTIFSEALAFVRRVAAARSGTALGGALGGAHA